MTWLEVVAKRRRQSLDVVRVFCILGVRRHSITNLFKSKYKWYE
jgi:uncharacterized membrane protein YeiB